MTRAKFHKFPVILFILVFIFTNTPSTFASSSFTDSTGHWAEKQLLEWSQKGWISGYPDGSIRPDAPITRTEYMALMNKAFGFIDKAEISFNDIQTANWQYPIIATAVKAGYVKGYVDGTIHPDNQLSRQEAAVMLADPLHLNVEASPHKTSFKDQLLMADWSYKAISALIDINVLTGYKDSTFRPTNSITRAEAVVMISRALQQRTIIYDHAGRFGPDQTSESVAGNVVITATGVTLKNMIIEGNLLFAASLGNGEAYIKNITIHGKTIVNGGGSNSIHFEDSTMGTITVNKKDGNVRIVAEGKTKVNEVNVESGAQIEQSNTSNGGFASIKLSEQLPPDSVIKLTGSFDQVDIAGKQVSLELSKGTIGKLNVDEKATESSIHLDKDSIVTNLVLNTNIHAKGEGRIEKATVSEQAKNSVLDVKTTVVEGKGAGDLKVNSPTPTATPIPDPNAPYIFVPPFIPPSSGVPGNPPVTEVVNHAPNGTVPTKTVVSGSGPWVIHLADFITDADGDAVTFSEMNSDKNNIAHAQLNGSNLTLTEVNGGNAVISFNYTDGKSATVSTSFVLKINVNIATHSSARMIGFHKIYVDLEAAYDTSKLSSTIVNVAEAFGGKRPLPIGVIRSASYQDAVKYGYSPTLAQAAAAKGIVITVNSNSVSATLYKVNISNLANTAGDFYLTNTTYVGGFIQENIEIDATVKIISQNKIYVDLEEDYDASKLSFATINIGEAVGLQHALSIAAISPATYQDAINYGYSAPLAQAAITKGIVITLNANTYSSTLYKVNVSNLLNVREELFTTHPAFNGAFIWIDSNVKMISGNKLYVDLNSVYDVSKLSSAVVNVAEYDGRKTSLAIEAISPASYQDAIDYGYSDSMAQAATAKGIMITLNSNSISNRLYNVRIYNLANLTGELCATQKVFAGIYTPTPTPTYMQSKAKMIASKKVYVDLEAEYDTSKLNSTIVNVTAYGQQNTLAIADISKATAQDAVEYGYSSTLAEAASAKGIVINLNEDTESGKTYQVYIYYLASQAGELVASQTSFVALGVSLSLPRIQSVQSLDNQTLEIFFDRDITSSSITGPIYNSNTHNIVTQALTLTNHSNVPIDLSISSAYAIEDTSNPNALIIRVTTPHAFKSINKNNFANGFKLDGDPAKFNTSYRSEIFSSSELDPIQIVADNVFAVNHSVIRVYFNQPVYGSLIDFAKIGNSQTTATNTFSNAVAIDSTHQIYDFALTTPMTTNGMYWLVANTIISKAIIGEAAYNTATASIVTLKDEDDYIQGVQQFREFSGSLSHLPDLIDVSVMMIDDKTIRVYYPTLMDTSSSSNSVLFAGNYSILNGSSEAVLMAGGALFNPTTDIAQIKYQTEDNTATITLNKKIMAPSNGVYMQFATTIMNAAGTQFVKQGTAAVKKQFVISSTPSAKVTVTNVTYNAAAGTITIKLYQLATSDANLAGSTNADVLLSVFNVAVATSGSNTYLLVPADIADIYVEDGDGHGIGNSSLNYFDTVVIKLTPAIANVLAVNQLGRVEIKTDAMTGMNGGRTQIYSNQPFLQ